MFLSGQKSPAFVPAGTAPVARSPASTKTNSAQSPLPTVASHFTTLTVGAPKQGGSLVAKGVVVPSSMLAPPHAASPLKLTEKWPRPLKPPTGVGQTGGLPHTDQTNVVSWPS